MMMIIWKSLQTRTIIIIECYLILKTTIIIIFSHQSDSMILAHTVLLYKNKNSS